MIEESIVSAHVHYLDADDILDRNGHGCMLQYALLHLFDYKVTLDDLKAFRVRIMSAYVGTVRVADSLISVDRLLIVSPQVIQKPKTHRALR